MAASLSDAKAVRSMVSRRAANGAVLGATAFNVDLTNVPKRLRVAVAVNGAAVSKKVLRNAIALVNKERGDSLYVYAIDDPSKHGSSIMQVKTDMDGICSSADVEPIWYIESLEEGNTAVHQLIQKAEKHGVDFLFVGSMGKGNTDGGGSGLSVLGTTCEYSLRNSLVNIIIVKNTAFEIDLSEGNGLTFFLATDHSIAAQAAFAWLTMCLVRPGRDKLIVLYSSDIASTTTLLEPYKAVMSMRGIDGDCVFDSYAGDEKPSDRIIDFSKKYDSDFIVMGVSGFGERKLGSVSLAVLSDTRSSALVVKEPGEVAEQRRIRVSLA